MFETGLQEWQQLTGEIGNRAVVQVFEGTPGIDVKKARIPVAGTRLTQANMLSYRRKSSSPVTV